MIQFILTSWVVVVMEGWYDSDELKYIFNFFKI